MKKNSTIYKNPQEQRIIDLSQLGTMVYAGGSIEIAQPNHFLQVGDVVYYNVKTRLFAKAVAVNSIESEVCGIVSEVSDKDNFVIINSGIIETGRYAFDEGAVLYLSDAHPGKLVSIAPATIIKQIATQLAHGIMVDIQRGYQITDDDSSEELEPYTQAELDAIIRNIW